MPSPQFIEEKPLCLADVQAHLHRLEKRDQELGFIAAKCKGYVEDFVTLSLEKKEELFKKLRGLQLTRLKEEHFAKIVDFLPKTVNELKIVLQAYPLSIPKKDQEAVVEIVKEFVK